MDETGGDLDQRQPSRPAKGFAPGANGMLKKVVGYYMARRFTPRIYDAPKHRFSPYPASRLAANPG
jgi:hypothetical protein